MKGSRYIFECTDLLEYHLHTISLNRGISYIDSPIWIKNKGVTIKINPKNTKNNNCFQYAIATALNYQNIGHHLERISKLEPFINLIQNGAVGRGGEGVWGKKPFPTSFPTVTSTKV